MGIYYNPDNESFKNDSNSRIYVDKTGLLEELNMAIATVDRYVALSHARRFGKTQAAGMIDAYYSIGSNSRELFSKFEIAEKPDFEDHLNKYNVIHVDVSSFIDNYEGNIADRIWNTVYEEMKEEVTGIKDSKAAVASILMDVCIKTGRQFVIIIDEWDCVVRNCSDNPDQVHKYLQFLHSLFKSGESNRYLALAYITGILPIKKIKDESALNNFSEYTMINSKNFTKYFGFTDDEVKELCQKHNMEYESVKEWYNGYFISGMHMYNPNSVYMAIRDHSFESYWKNTSSFGVINTYIEMDYDGLKQDVIAMLEGKQVDVDTSTFTNDLSEVSSKDEALTALIHLGYLGYDSELGEAYIPNYEVATAFTSAIKNRKKINK